MEDDLEEILRIRDDARKDLAGYHVDQWQGSEPSEETLQKAIGNGECFAVLHGDELAAFFILSTLPVPEYEAIRDGKWTDVPVYAALRVAAVAKRYRGSGTAESRDLE